MNQFIDIFFRKNFLTILLVCTPFTCLTLLKSISNNCSTMSLENIVLITLLPTKIEYGGISFVTIDLAPITASWPIVTPHDQRIITNPDVIINSNTISTFFSSIVMGINLINTCLEQKCKKSVYSHDDLRA